MTNLKNDVILTYRALLLTWFSGLLVLVLVSVRLFMCLDDLSSVWVAEWPPFGKELPIL